MVNKQVVNNTKKKKVKRLSANTYYPSAFISNPCEQLFGPSLNYSIDLDVSSSDQNKSINNSSLVNDESNNESTSNISNLNNPIDTSTNKPDHNDQIVKIVNSQPDDQQLIVSNNIITTSSTIDYATSATMSNTTIYQQYESSTSDNNENNSQNSYDFEYIPAPRWNKAQNSLLEELFKKSRYPKPAELKSFAQRLHVMDTDVEEWFRKRRGRDRKTRRKNEALKNLIDNYLDK